MESVLQSLRECLIMPLILYNNFVQTWVSMNLQKDGLANAQNIIKIIR
jgi:hypothetical protein